jgi:HEPN domain-containing protein
VPKRYPPEDPREWLNRARSNLAEAKVGRKGVYLEDLCFDAQQAAEKAIKVVLIKQDVKFPYIHDLAELLTLADETGIKIPKVHENGRRAQ